MMRKFLSSGWVVLALGGCAMFQHGPAAQVTLQPTQGNTAAGTMTFKQKGEQVAIDAEISGLTPGQHGFHIHEKGDCSAPDGTSAGGHFNPTKQPHGDPNGAAHHVGDLPMLMADANGHASLHIESKAIALQGEQSVIGKAVIIHQKMDDYATQPTGNSGARVACGVISASQ